MFFDNLVIFNLDPGEFMVVDITTLREQLEADLALWQESLKPGYREAKALRSNRIKQKFSLRSLHEATKNRDPAGRGISVSHLHRVEKRVAHLTIPQVYLIAGALGVSSEVLFADIFGDEW